MTDLVRETLAAYESQINFALLTVVHDPIDSGLTIGAKLLLTEKGETSGSLGGGPIQERALAEAREAIRLGQSVPHYYGPEGKRLSRRDRAVGIFIEVVLGDLSLVIVGGGHVGQAIGKVASQCGYRIVVVDDRPAFASRERFPEADQILVGDFQEVLSHYPINAMTHLVMVTRGHKHDEISLRTVVESPAFYVGMIGSKRRVATVLRHLEEEGVPKEALERVHTPIGLDIGAETPEEIAVSIVAEMIMKRRGGTGRPMSIKERRGVQ